MSSFQWFNKKRQKKIQFVTKFSFLTRSRVNNLYTQINKGSLKKKTNSVTSDISQLIIPFFKMVFQIFLFQILEKKTVLASLDFPWEGNQLWSRCGVLGFNLSFCLFRKSTLRSVRRWRKPLSTPHPIQSRRWRSSATTSSKTTRRWRSAGRTPGPRWSPSAKLSHSKHTETQRPSTVDSFNCTWTRSSFFRDCRSTHSAP